MRLTIAVLTALLCILSVRGQTWQEVYDDVMTMTDDDEAGQLLHDSYELLEQLAGQPFDLNRATREELEQLPFLSAQQVMDIEEYIYLYGGMRSLGELRMVRSLDIPQLMLLPYFVYVTGAGDTPEEQFLPVDTLLRRSRHTLTATGRIPFYEREGDRNGYLGYRYRHSLRYELTSCNRLRLGLIGAQDAGEPFFAAGNSQGYDVYSYYVQLRDMGRLSNAVVGKYKMSAGAGLVLGQSFQLGKLATLQSLGRTVSTIRPHASRSEADYFQGAAATCRLLGDGRRGPQLQLSAFASYRAMDATLNGDSAAQTLITTGYHRTPAEMGKKHNTHIAAGGAHLDFHMAPLRVGATVVASHIDRPLEPQRQTLYRRHWAHGSDFMNASVDYSLRHHRLSLSGETAIDDHGNIATLNTLSLQPSARLGLMVLQRYYSYEYNALYGHSFGETSRTQNESGIYIGATWNPLAHLHLQAYADYAYFPWARYQVSQSSHSTDLLLQATYTRGPWSLQARHRSRLRQKDNADKSALTANDDHRERLFVAYKRRALTLKTQFDLSATRYQQQEHGWMVSQQASFQRTTGKSLDEQRSMVVSAMAAYFNTDSYQSRIYVYERQLQHEFYFPTYYGEGLRLALMARADVTPRLRLAVRMGYTNYFDRSTIGTGLQQIAHSHQTDLDLQLRWRLGR